MVIILISEVGLTVCAVNLTRARSECPCTLALVKMDTGIIYKNNLETTGFKQNE